MILTAPKPQESLARKRDSRILSAGKTGFRIRMDPVGGGKTARATCGVRLGKAVVRTADLIGTFRAQGVATSMFTQEVDGDE